MFHSLRLPFFRILLSLTVPVLLISCSKGVDSQDPLSPSALQVSQRFVNSLVLPAYRDLAAQTKVLQVSLEVLAKEPTAAHLMAARQDWETARSTWETTESWAFGPASTLGFDGNLDDWPVSRLELSQALATDPFNQSVFAALGTTARGFHGIEYVLFGDGENRPMSDDFTPRELSYLKLAGADLHRNAEELLGSWSGNNGFGGRLTASAEEAQATIAEMLQGVMGTLEEVGDEKVGAVLAEGTPDGLESRFSGNTNADLLANLQGAQAVFEQTDLDDLIAAKAPDVAEQLSERMERAIRLAEALPGNLKDRLDEPATRQAMEQLMEGVHDAVESTRRVIELIS